MSAERWAARADILRPVSEWAGRELTVALSISAEAADQLLHRSLTLVHRLPGTLAALEAGALHSGHLWTMLEKVAPITDSLIRAEVEAELLRWAASRVVTPAQLGAKARREVARRDARAAARRLQEALKERGVHLRPHSVDGMATVTVVATMPEAQALYRALCDCAKTLDGADGDPRTRGQKMVDCLLDLVLRPGETDLPPVQVLLTVVASIATLAGGDAPGEVDGQVVPAEMIRELLTALTAARQPDVTSAERCSDDAVPWQEAEQEDLTRWWAEMERRVLAGEPADSDPLPHHDTAFATGIGARPDARGQTTPGALFDHLRDEPLDQQPPETCWNDPPEWLLDEDASPPETAVRAPDINHASTSPTCESPPPASPDPSSGDAGWWAAADRAVEDAGQSLFEVGQKLSRAQRLVRTAAAADSADESVWQAGPTGRVTAAEDAVGALRAATDAQREQLADLLATTGGGGLADRPRIALTHALSGALLALTDLPRLIRAGTCGRAECRGNPAPCSHDVGDRPGLGAPGHTDGYRPSAELDRWTRARDRRCRFPGCRRRVPRGGELDHDRPYPLGPTSGGNLVGYCTADHRGKHQAPGWRHELEPDGTLTVTTPTGLVAATSPPPY